jgi:CO/xanthine dehydrogenase Mo-binding subunit
VAALAGWDGQRSSSRLAYGLAAGIYKDMAYAAVVAEVELSADHSARVRRMWCAHDCGQVINPDQVRAQVEGNLTWGLGMALREGLYVEEGRIAAESYADYAVALFSDSPEIAIELVEEGEPPTGAGESAIVAATAAITNAIAAATGQTVTRLPYDPETQA